MNAKIRFQYEIPFVTELRVTLSAERFAGYEAWCNGDPVEAAQLYAWNTAVASAFYGPLQALEVTLRNAVHDRLAANHGLAWYDNANLLRPGEIRMAGDAKDKIQRANKAVTPGRVVAELGFGYWVGLFANVYDNTLWRTFLFRAFQPRPSRSDLHDELNRLRTLRNRVAHHEPIYTRNLLDDYNRLLDVLGRLSPDVRGWVEHHNRVLHVLGMTPEECCEF